MNTVQRSAANCPPLSWTGSVISLFWKQKTDNLRAYVVILDLEYMHICDRQSTTLCASVYEVLCPTLCLYGCIFFVYYVCITWACIFVYVCYPLLDQVYWYVVLLCYICYIELKNKIVGPLFISSFLFYLSQTLLDVWCFSLFCSVYCSFLNRLDLIREPAFYWCFIFPFYPCLFHHT